MDANSSCTKLGETQHSVMPGYGVQSSSHGPTSKIALPRGDDGRASSTTGKIDAGVVASVGPGGGERRVVTGKCCLISRFFDWLSQCRLNIHPSPGAAPTWRGRAGLTLCANPKSMSLGFCPRVPLSQCVVVYGCTCVHFLPALRIRGTTLFDVSLAQQHKYLRPKIALDVLDACKIVALAHWHADSHWNCCGAESLGSSHPDKWTPHR